MADPREFLKKGSKSQGKGSGQGLGSGSGSGSSSQRMEFEKGTGPVSKQRKKEALDFIREGKDTGVVGEFGSKQTGVVQPSAGLRRRLPSYLEEAKYKTLQSQGVDIESGGDASTRMELSFTPKERKDEVLNEAFPLGWRQTDLGIVAKVPSKEKGEKPREVLLDERGFSFKDLADAAGSTPEILGAFGGAGAALASLPATATAGGLGMGVVALASALGGQAGGGVFDGIQIMQTGGFDVSDKEDRKMLNRIVRERGIGVATDMFLDIGTVSGLKGLGAVGRKAAAPFAENMNEPGQKGIINAADRLGVRLMPSERTGASSVARAEAIGEKIPGSTGVFEELRNQGSRDVNEISERMTQRKLTSEEVGERISEESTRQLREGEATAGELRTQAQRTLEKEIRSFADKMYRDGSVTPDEAGHMVRLELQRQKEQFDARQEMMENEVQRSLNELPEEKRKFVPTDEIKARVQEIKDSLPQERQLSIDGEGNLVETEKEINEMIPGGLRPIINGVEKLEENVTPGQLRSMRARISEAINGSDAISSYSQGLLKSLETSMTRALERGVKKAPSKDVRQAMQDALKHYRENVDKFRGETVNKAFRNPGERGAAENRQLLPELILNGRGEEARRLMEVLGPKSEAARASRRAAFEEILSRSRDQVQDLDAIDPQRLVTELDKLGRQGRKALFREQGEFPVLQRARKLAARYNYISPEAFKTQGDPSDPVEMLKRAQRIEEDLRKQFHTRVFKRFLKGEVDESAMSPSKFVRFSLNNASSNEIKTMMDRLEPETAREYQKAVITQLLHRASKEFQDAQDAARFIDSEGKQAGFGERLNAQLQRYSDDPEDSFRKLRTIMNYKTAGELRGESPQRGARQPFDVVKDLAKVQTARSRRAESAKAAGGLIGGSILSNLLSANFRSVPQLVKYRVMAELLTRPTTRRWLTRQRPQRGRSSPVGEAYQYALPEVIESIGTEAGEDYEGAQQLADFFRPENVERMVRSAAGEDQPPTKMPR